MENLPIKTEDPQRYYLMENQRRNIPLSSLYKLSSGGLAFGGIGILILIFANLFSISLPLLFTPASVLFMLVGGIGMLIARLAKSNRSDRWKSEFARNLLPELLQAQFPDYECKTYRNINQEFVKKLEKLPVDENRKISGVAYFSVSGKVQELDVFVAKIGVFKSNGHTSLFSGNIILVKGKDFRESTASQIETTIKRIKKELEQGFNTKVSFHISSYDLCYFLISPSRIELKPKDDESLFSSQYFEHNYEKIKVLVSIAEKMAGALA